MAKKIAVRRSRLSGVEKAAVIMSILEKDQREKLFDLMDEKEVRSVSYAMLSIPKVTTKIIQVLINEFLTKIATADAEMKMLDNMEGLLNKILDKEKVTEIMAQVRGSETSTLWIKLEAINDDILADYLRTEYPQISALVISKLSPDKSARILSYFEEELACDLIMRILNMKSVQKQVLVDIERSLKAELMADTSGTKDDESYRRVAEIFNYLDKGVDKKLLSNLETKDKEKADTIKSLMFTFDDIKKLQQDHIRLIIKSLNRPKMVLALKGTTDDMRELFFSNMPERAARLMKEELEDMGAVRVRSVEEAQNYIVGVAKELAEKGDIVIGKPKPGDELIF